MKLQSQYSYYDLPHLKIKHQVSFLIWHLVILRDSSKMIFFFKFTQLTTSSNIPHLSHRLREKMNSSPVLSKYAMCFLHTMPFLMPFVCLEHLLISLLISITVHQNSIFHGTSHVSPPVPNTRPKNKMSGFESAEPSASTFLKYVFHFSH